MTTNVGNVAKRSEMLTLETSIRRKIARETMTNETDDFEDEWADLDEKVILVQILTELQQIRMTLTDATDDNPDRTKSAQTIFKKINQF